MHVLLVHSRPLEFGKTVGGVPEFLFAITKELQQLGIRVSIYAGHKSFKTLTHTSTAHGDINIYSGPIIEPGFWVSRKKIAGLVTLCQHEKFDLIHSQGAYTPGFMVRELSRMTGIPYLVTSHSDIHPVNSMRLKRRNVRSRIKRILKDAAWVTHLTPVMEQASHDIYDTSQKSTRIHNGIHLEKWLPYRGLSEKNYLLGIGRLERGKGFHVLIDMYAELVKRKHTCGFIIAGTGHEEAALKQQCEKMNLSMVTGYQHGDSIPANTVIFAGYVRDQLKYQIIAESLCVLFATQPDLWEEAFGIVQLEAMAAAKPLVASDIAATRYLESQGLKALIVPPADPEAWANSVEKLIQRAELRRRLGADNARTSQAFDWRDIAKAYLKVYEDVLTGLPSGLNA